MNLYTGKVYLNNHKYERCFEFSIASNSLHNAASRAIQASTKYLKDHLRKTGISKRISIHLATVTILTNHKIDADYQSVHVDRAQFFGVAS
jgi:hypothetical protein